VSEPVRVRKRKCRYCGRTFKVRPDYPKRSGCPECAPQLLSWPRDDLAEILPERPK